MTMTMVMIMLIFMMVVNIENAFSSQNHHGDKAKDTPNYFDFTDEEIEALRNKVTFSRSHYQQLNLGLLSLTLALTGSARGRQKKKRQ